LGFECQGISWRPLYGRVLVAEMTFCRLIGVKNMPLWRGAIILALTLLEVPLQTKASIAQFLTKSSVIFLN